MSGMQVLVLWLVGAGLLVVEAFAPGAVLGILGALACTAAVVLAYVYEGPLAGTGLLVASVVVGGAVVWWAARRMGLRHELKVEGGFVATADLSHLVGHKGEALTVLRPAGCARLDGKRVDVVTAGEFIPAGTVVVVTLVEGSRVEVRPA